eukprot:3910415-Rhodomonas_salina.1
MVPPCASTIDFCAQTSDNRKQRERGRKRSERVRLRPGSQVVCYGVRRGAGLWDCMRRACESRGSRVQCSWLDLSTVGSGAVWCSSHGPIETSTDQRLNQPTPEPTEA